jgi:hypothetical protein
MACTAPKCGSTTTAALRRRRSVLPNQVELCFGCAGGSGCAPGDFPRLAARCVRFDAQSQSRQTRRTGTRCAGSTLSFLLRSTTGCTAPARSRGRGHCPRTRARRYSNPLHYKVQWNYYCIRKTNEVVVDVGCCSLLPLLLLLLLLLPLQVIKDCGNHIGVFAAHDLRVEHAVHKPLSAIDQLPGHAPRAITKVTLF